MLSGALWSGADLFMGFILGPTLRMLDIRARTALIAYLVPRTLLYFLMVSLTTIITMGKVSVHQVSCRKSGRGGGVVSIISIRYLAAGEQRRLALVPSLVSWAKPVPALCWICVGGLGGIDDEAGLFFSN